MGRGQGRDGTTAAGRTRSPAARPKATAEHGKAAGVRADVMLARVRAAGLKLTPQRMAIVRELAADPTHPTAQELFERLRPTLPTMSFATVYNTLDALASAGLCAALALAPGASRFDPNMAAHHHAVCDGCGLVRDVAPPNEANEADELEGGAAALAGTHPSRMPAVLAEAPGFEIRSVERIYRGLCAGCAAAAEAQRTRGGSPRPPARREAAPPNAKRRTPERSRSA